MEAANLGAYMANKKDAALDDALQILQNYNAERYEFDFLDTESADSVICKYGSPSYKENLSLGIPTFFYGMTKCWDIYLLTFVFF
jgi:hypothetical protein